MRGPSGRRGGVASTVFGILLLLTAATARTAGDVENSHVKGYAKGYAKAYAKSYAKSYAEQITPENAALRLVGGSDAIGGVGDWALGNGVLCAVISDPSHESYLTPVGGVLVDLGRCGLAHDEWITLEMLLNMSRQQMLGVSRIRAEPDRPDGSVAVVTGCRSLGLEVETTYRLDPERPHALGIETRAWRLPESESDDASERAFLFGEVVLHGRRQLAPFTLTLAAEGRGVRPLGSVGFAHPAVDPDDFLTMIRAILPANLHVLLGGDRQRPGVAYGLRFLGARLEGPDGVSQPLPHLAINGESFTMQGVFTRPFLVGGGESGDEVGWLELAQTLLMDIEPGETVVFEREILVGARADVASVTDQLWPDAPLVRGQVEPAARVHVATADGTPVTQVRPDAMGTFALRLPAGRYSLKVRAAAGREHSQTFEVTAAGLDLGRISLVGAASEPGRVLLPRGRPMRLVFVREEDGERQHFGDDLLGFEIGTQPHRGSQFGPDVVLGGVATDPRRIDLPAGTYRVVATRGPEFGLTEARISVVAGQLSSFAIDSPERVLEHPGWVSADLHVHSEWSDDSNYPVDRQIAAFVAEGADLIVSSEHDRVVDYGPLIRRLGLANRVSSLVGVEATSSAHTPEAPETAAHSNAFPLPYEPHAFRGGAPRAEGRRLRDIIADVHALPGRPIVQLNHPRSKSGSRSEKVSDLNFFTHLSVAGEPFQPRSPLSALPNRVLLERDPTTGLRDLDFDLIELWNGDSLPQYRAVRSDWIALLLQGEFRPGVANSDSHVRGELIAYPRTYVQMPDAESARPGAVDAGAFVAALRAGNAFGSSGPLLDVTLATPDGTRTGPGDLHRGATGTLHVAVQSAPWVPVSQVRVWWNGRAVHAGGISRDAGLELPLRFERDGFVTVEVRGEPGPDYELVVPGFEPFAFSNPIFVDADGDGVFSAPGLPAQPLPILDPEAVD